MTRSQYLVYANRMKPYIIINWGCHQDRDFNLCLLNLRLERREEWFDVILYISRSLWSWSACAVARLKAKLFATRHQVAPLPSGGGLGTCATLRLIIFFRNL